MTKWSPVLLVLSLFLAPVLFAQSADMALTVTDSPDPVAPDGNITYTVTVTNAGPNAASNVTLSSFGGNNLRFVSASVPAGWNCTLPASGTQTTSYTCTLASMTSGDSDVLTFVMQADDAILGNNDQTIHFGYSVNSSTADPVNNNSETEATQYVAPDADLSITVSDSPDPVAPDGNITYTVTVANAGPDTASSLTLSSFGGNNLRFVSASVPAGWNCTLPASGTQTTSYTCTLASMTSGDSDVLTFVMQADDAILGNTDQPINFGYSVNSSTFDPVNNNSETETTQYVAPDADLSITVSDSPDPVTPDGNITYTVTVANAGPDTASNVTLSSFGGNNLRFVSASVPAGWNCTLPASGTQTTSYTCTLASMISGDSDVLTFVMQADDAILGNSDQPINFGYSVNSSTSDPVNNNSETETTQYVTPDADLSISASDSPDPVGRDEHITYTVTLSNAGPDSAAATLNVPMNGFLKFTSMTVPAGFVCSGVPAPGAASTYSCTDTTFASGDTAQFTIVMHTDPNSFGLHDGVINQPFTVTSNISDPDNDDNQVTVTTTYDPATSNLGVTATDSPDPVNAGSNITYSGTVTNAGPDAGTNTTLTIPLSSSLLFQSLTPPTGFSCTTPAVGANGTITCTIASLANGASLPFTLVARVNPSLASGPDGFIEQTFLIDSDNGDPATANNELDVTTQYLTPDADLVATNSDSPDPVVSGGTITYTQTIANTGPNAATNVTFTQTLPASVGFQSISAPAGFTCTTPAVGASGTITCTAASLANGAGGTFTLRVTVLASSGTVGNTVTADSDTFDPDTTDNSASVATTITAAPSSDLSVTKTTTTTTATPGSTIPFTISIANNGPDAAGGVVMTDALPAQLRFQSITAPTGFTCTTPAAGTNGTITCNAATLANGATAAFSLVTTVAPGASGNVTNSATVSSTTNDPNGANSSGSSGVVTVTATSADLSIVKNTATTTAPAGSSFNYTITIANAGPNAASSVVMTDVLPASLLFQSITAPTGFTCTTPAIGANGTITCTASSLANGANAVFTLRVRVASGSTSGTVTNNASVSSSTGDPDAGDTSDGAPAVTLAPASADVSVVKSTTSTFAATGSTLTYTINVANAGPSSASNVVVTDTLPAGLQFVSATPSQGTCTGTTTVTCNLGAIANGGNATITLQTIVTATSGTVSNTATVASTEADADPGDNASSTPPTPVGEGAAVAAVPTLSEWALIALAGILGMLAMMKIRM